MLPLGREILAPYVKPNAQGGPMYALPGQPGQPLPYLAYAPGAYLGRAVEQLVKQSPIPVHLDRIYETDMAEGLKAMALEGHGVAFLPATAVRKDVRAKKLVSAGDGLETALDIRIYRERPNARKAKRALEKFWQDLQTRLGSAG
jgi:DNA-binding transcriptional LysR family regulator